MDTDVCPSKEKLDEITFVRATQRGQNLDRAGLSARHMKLLNMLSSPVSASELAAQCGMQAEEVYRVMHGFMRADLVTSQKKRDVNTVITVTGDAGHAK